MKDFSVTVVFLIVTLFVIVAIVFSPNVNVGFAVSSLYPGYALPLSYVVNSFLVFPNVSSTISRVFDVSDTVIYRYGYVSYDGQPWTPFTLTTSNVVSGDWIYTKGTASISFTLAQLRMSLSRNVSNNTFVVVYSCSRTTSNAWDCHDGWQITKFDAMITVPTSPALVCTPNVKGCLSTTVFRQCNSVGSTWVNNNCPTGQTCSGAGICSTPALVCGDGVCNNGETCSSCPGDCGTCVSSLNTFYIDPNGVDSSSRSGSVSLPWKTLAYACSQVKTSGSVIHVNQGTYTETQQCQLAVGVSIEGEHTNPLTSIIISNYAPSSILDNFYDASILLLSSSSATTDGDQSISYIKLDGNNLAGKRGISVRFRNYVSIHHSTISNFEYSGIYFSGATVGFPTPTSSRYDHDNSIYNCNIINDAHQMDDTGIYGELWYDAQQDFLIHDNVFNSTVRAAGNNGDNMKGLYSKGLKIYNNIFYRHDNEGNEWNFFSELFFTAGGMEIYNNTFYGQASLDIVDVRKGTSYDYGVKIYDNQFLVDAQTPENYHGMQAIDFEDWGQVQYAYIYNNHFKNSNTGIQFDATGGYEGSSAWETPVNGAVSFDHIYIYYNVFENLGAIKSPYYAAIVMKPQSVNAPLNIVWNQIYIDNNDIISSTYPIWCGIEWQQGGNYSNLYIRNNIIQGSLDYPIIFTNGDPGTQSNVYIQNNLYYLNGANQLGYNGGTSASEITGLTQSTLTPANPSFKSSTEFHLNPSSPAIDKGISTDWTYDYDSNSVPYGSAPDIGAYEYHP